MDLFLNLLGPLHPVFAHFSVACPFLALFALILQKFLAKPWLSETAASLWVFGFLSACASWLTGHFFSLHLGLVGHWSLLPDPSASRGVLREHALLGSLALLSSILTLAAAIRTFREKPLSRNYQLVLALVTAVFFGWTGNEGGEMVYGAEREVAQPPARVSPAGPGLLERSRDYRVRLLKMNSRMWNSRTHGHRWVNIYVSKEAAAAYIKGSSLPEGSLVVKESFEDGAGSPSTRPGPLYVMEKGPAAGSPGTGGWLYALSWDEPAPGNPEGIVQPARWAPGDSRLTNCARCHDRFRASDHLGGIPEGFENP